MHPAFGIRLGADLPALGGNATDEPLSVPELLAADFLHGGGHGLIIGRIILPAQLLGQLHKIADGPIVQEADHGALAAAQVQAVVPVRPQALADAVRAYLLGGEVQDALHMVVDRALAAVGIAHHRIRKAHVAGLPDVLDDGAHQPQGIVGAGVLQAVDDLALVRGGHHRRGLKGLLLLLGLEPPGFEQMQAVALIGQGLQQLYNALLAALGIGMDHHHSVLCGVPVAQAHPAAHLDKGGEPGEHDVDLALIQVPDVQLGIHGLAGGGDLEAFQALVPEFCGLGKVPVHPLLGVLPAHGAPRFQAALTQQEQKPLLLAGLQGNGLHQRAAVVAALPEGAGALACLHGPGIPLGAVIPQEGIPAAVEAVRGEVSGEELEAVLFIIEVLFDNAVFIPAAGGIEAHLEILVVHGDLVEAEFQIGKYGQIPLFSGIVAQPHVPNLHRVVNGRKQGLLGIDAGVVAKILAVAQAVAAGIVLLGLAHGLPGHGPEIPGIVVPEVDIVAGAVHGAIGPEAGNAVVLRGLVEHIARRSVVEDTVEILQANVVGPGCGDIHPVDDILPAGVVKIAITHRTDSSHDDFFCP